MTREPLRVPRCDDVKLLMHEDESLELLFRTEASDRRITVPITDTLALSLRGILAMHYEPDDAPHF